MMLDREIFEEVVEDFVRLGWVEEIIIDGVSHIRKTFAWPDDWERQYRAAMTDEA